MGVAEHAHSDVGSSAEKTADLLEGHVGYAEQEIDENSSDEELLRYVISPDEQKALLRRLDVVLGPLVCILVLPFLFFVCRRRSCETGTLTSLSHIVPHCVPRPLATRQRRVCRHAGRHQCPVKRTFCGRLHLLVSPNPLLCSARGPKESVLTLRHIAALPMSLLSASLAVHASLPRLED